MVINLTSQKTNKSNLEFIDLMYVIGVLYVVIGHSTINYVSDWGAPNLRESSIATLINSYVYSFHMPLFFFISGYVFRYNIHMGKYKEFKHFVLNKFNRLMIPFLFVGILFVSPINLILGNYNSNNFISATFNDILLGKSPSQLWYLEALFILFIIYYFLRKIIDKYINNIFVNIVIICVFIFLRYIFDFGIGYFMFDMALNYLLYFHLGYITLSKNILTNISYKKATILITTHFSFLIFSYFIDTPINGLISSLLGIYAYFSIAKIIIITFPNILKIKMLNVIRKNNLGIYLYHQQIILLLLQSYVFRSLNPIIVISISFIVSIVVSLLITKIIDLLILNFKTQKHIQARE